MSYYCSVCKETIKKKEYNFSMTNYQKPLCRIHQKPFESKEGKLYVNKKVESTQEALDLGKALADRDWKVSMEKWDGHKHIDISIFAAKVDIEVDGPQHSKNPKQALADLKRTYYSFKKGWITLRIPNCLVQNYKVLQETADYISKMLKQNTQEEGV